MDKWINSKKIPPKTKEKYNSISKDYLVYTELYGIRVGRYCFYLDQWLCDGSYNVGNIVRKLNVLYYKELPKKPKIKKVKDL